MKKIKVGANTTQFLNQAWARNGNSIVTGEALIIGLLLHTTAGSRNSDDLKVVQALMGDINYEED